MSRSSPGSDFATEEYALPCVEAVLAGTLALMTGVAQAAPGCPHVGSMAAKIVCNLGVLADHPQLSEPMRQLLARLIARGEPVARSALAGELALPEKALWLRSPATVQ